MAPKYETLNRVSNASVQKHTGKIWDEWVAVLDKAGARIWDHQQLVEFLHLKHKLTRWWRQVVSIGYENAIGKRVEGQNLKGQWSSTTTKTMPFDQKTLWSWMQSEEALAIWLKPLSEYRFQEKLEFEGEGGIFGEVRTLKAPERVRMTWNDSDWVHSTTLQIWMIRRPQGRSLIVFTHEKLANGRERAQIKARWEQVVGELHALAALHPEAASSSSIKTRTQRGRRPSRKKKVSQGKKSQGKKRPSAPGKKRK